MRVTKAEKRVGKRGEKDEGNENEELIIELSATENSTTLTTVFTAPPTWITKLRKPEFQAELSNRSIKFEKKDDKSVLVELLHQFLLRQRREILLSVNNNIKLNNSFNNFLNTDNFRRLFVGLLPGDTLMTLRLTTKG